MSFPASDAAKVQASFQRCAENPAFIDDFYAFFVGMSPAVAAAFAHTDMDQQAVMLRASLELILPGDEHGARQQVLGRLARLHGPDGVNIPPRLYDYWLEALLDTLAVHDPDYNPALEAIWRRVLVEGVKQVRQCV
ncbi:hypothetical protein [Motiliproteus sp. SC1-56]|uniref:hypothetical protein n=1 Tax=Motiliproteus sp. SC1-56 TaxID=2799565 RepID=UPI001A8D8D4F|nr:hypothetical protein [Motiliproteus sp. SC1-56]